MKALRLFLASATALVAMTVPSVHAADPVTKCRSTIVKATTQLLSLQAKVLAKCMKQPFHHQFPATSCPDARASLAIGKAEAKLRTAIDKACGGRDKICGGTELDVGLLEIGWGIGSCDQTGSTSCSNVITDCAGVATCVTCLAEQGVADALSLFAGRPAVDPLAQPALAECLDAITVGSIKSFAKVAKGAGDCWLKVSGTGSGGSFSCPNRGASIAAGKAKAVHLASVCRACGGTNRKCNGGEDITLAAVGFPTSCPAIASCGGAVQTLQDMTNCADCVGHALMDAAVRRTIPQFSSVPPSCTP